MAETKLAMSLDELIAQAGKRKERRPAPQRQPGGSAPQSGPRKGLNKNKQKAAANGNGAGQQPRPKQQPQQQQQQQQQQQGQRQGQGQQGGQRNRKGGAPNLGVRGGQVQKRSVIEVPAKMLRAPLQAPPPQRRQPQPRQPAPDGKWQHDLYQDDYAPPRRAAPATQVTSGTSSKLVITNLHHQVSEDDLLELFSTCGTVKSRAINFDNSGRSLGTGWIVFETRTEAEKAKREYHGVKLDGKPMEISFASEASMGPSMLTKLSSGIMVQKPGAGGAGAGGGGGGRSGGAGKAGGAGGGQRLAAAAIRETAAASRGGRSAARGNRLRSAVVGSAQLDADLQDYMQE